MNQNKKIKTLANNLLRSQLLTTSIVTFYTNKKFPEFICFLFNFILSYSSKYFRAHSVITFVKNIAILAIEERFFDY